MPPNRMAGGGNYLNSIKVRPMEAFFNLGQAFVNEPLRAFALALLFMGFALIERWLATFVAGIKPWVQLVPATGWMLFAINEEHARAAQVAHRFDLAITLPVLAVLTLIGVIALATNVRRAVRDWQAHDREGDR